MKLKSRNGAESNPTLLNGVAGHRGLAGRDHARRFDAAALTGMRAARVERTAFGRIQWIRYFALDLPAPLAVRIELRHGVEQHAGIGMARLGKQRLGGGDLDDTA